MKVGREDANAETGRNKNERKTFFKKKPQVFWIFCVCEPKNVVDFSSSGFQTRVILFGRRLHMVWQKKNTIVLKKSYNHVTFEKK